jgi:lipid A 3-O-deacylase
LNRKAAGRPAYLWGIDDMMGFWRSLSVAGAMMVMAAGAAQADEASDPPLLAFGAGVYDVLQTDDAAADFRIEYRHGPAWLGFIKPFAGLEVTTDGGVWGGAGLLLDIKLTDNFAIGLSSGPGFYSDGDGKDLGHTVEFRSQIEAAYIFEDKGRLALAFSHLSNAGLGDTNPGTEVLTLYYMMPLTF